MYRSKVLFFFIIPVIFVALLVFTPIAYAAGRASGYILDNAGNGINGAIVKLSWIRTNCPIDDPGADCTTETGVQFRTTTPHPQTARNGYYNFVNEDGDSTIGCRLTYELAVQMPGSTIFVPVPNNGPPPPDESSNIFNLPSKYFSSVFSVSKANAQQCGVPVCRVVVGYLPGVVIGNVQSGQTSYHETVCEPGPACPSSSPSPTPTKPPVTCGTDCTNKPDICAGVKDPSGKDCSQCGPDAKDPSKNVCRPPLACGVACSTKNPAFCAGAKDANGQDCSTCVPTTPGGDTGTCQPAQACGSPCDTTKPDTCKPGAKFNCDVCRPNNSGQDVCQPAPACESKCTGDKDCIGAKNGCTVCSPSTKTCKPPVSCDSPCAANKDCDDAKSCTACVGNEGARKCEAFDSSLCHCDQMDASQIFSGQDATFTAYAKVEENAIVAAEVKFITFSLFRIKNGDLTNTTRISGPVDVPAQVIERTSKRIRYKAVWTVKMPSNVSGSDTFKAFASLQTGCQRIPSKVAGASVEQVESVIESPKNENIFENIVNVIQNVFSGKASVLADTTENNQLILEPFYPTKSVIKSCNAIDFQFGL